MFLSTRSRVFFFESVDGVRYDDTALNAIRAANRRKWTTIITLVVLVVIGVAIFAYSKVSKSRQDALVTAYIQAERLYNSEQENYISEMQKPGADPQKLGKPDHMPSAQKFEEFARANSSHSLAWVAAFRAASEFIDKGKADSAISLLELVANRTMKHSLVQVRSRRTLAGLYADKNDYVKALAELDILEKIPNNPILSESRLFKAKVLYLAGKKEEAAKLLKELANSTDITSMGDRSSVANEASLWLGYWGL